MGGSFAVLNSAIFFLFVISIPISLQLQFTSIRSSRSALQFTAKANDTMEQSVSETNNQDNTKLQDLLSKTFSKSVKYSKNVINGDTSQIDLPNKSLSGLKKSKNLLGHLKEISVVDFDHADVVRHPLVSKIVKAYNNNDKS